MSKDLHSNITALIPLVEGIVKLLHPFAEGAVHDLKQGKIVALYNNISKRKLGDPSAVTELKIEPGDFPDVFEPYYKINWDGRKLKCTSVTVRDECGEPIGLVCINFDTSVFGDMTVNIDKLISIDSTGLNPVEQFSDNWEQQVLDYIDDFSKRKNTAVKSMNKDLRAELVSEMYDHALFNYRDAASFIARQLDVSRTTIYNYLREEESHEN